MGYTTDFTGVLKLNKKLTDEDKEFLDKFNNTRRMARDVDAKYGIEGEYYVDGGGMMGQDRDDTIIDYNRPPKTQPSLWCQWMPTDDGWGIEWDGGEKFYNYVQWLEYLIANFLAPNGYLLNGTIDWEGEDNEDIGKIVVKDNDVKTLRGVVTYPDTPEEIDNHTVFETIDRALNSIGLYSEMGSVSASGGIENLYVRGDYKVTIEIRN